MSEERVHELLYSCDSRTELCEMIAGLEDENAKINRRKDELESDNIKLRELIVRLKDHYHDAEYEEFDALNEINLWNLMYALGLEVENGLEAQV